MRLQVSSCFISSAKLGPYSQDPHGNRNLQLKQLILNSTYSPISHLPTELIICILEQLYFSEEGFQDLSLKSCSRVCRQWRYPSQTLLFRCGFLDQSRKNLEQLVKVFERNPILASYVRSISIHISLVSEKGGKSYSVADLIPIVSLFPKLSGLVIRTRDYETGEAIASRAIGAKADRSIRLPRLISLELDHGANSRLAYSLLRLWPSIQHLTCFGTYFGYLPLPGPRPNFVLRHLGLDDLPSTQILDWLLPQKTLQSVHLNLGSDWQGAIRPFLERHGPGLRSLRLDYVTEAFIRCCPNLEELDVRHMMLAFSDETIESFPKCLKHIRIRHPTLGTAPLVRLVSSLPELRWLRLPRAMKWLLGAEERTELEDLARRHGVTVSYEVTTISLVRLILVLVCII